jgi:hypothetical protein
MKLTKKISMLTVYIRMQWTGKEPLMEINIGYRNSSTFLKNDLIMTQKSKNRKGLITIRKYN